VGAVILHAASIAADFVDQLAQAPVQVQCVQQATPESWLKWLFQLALSVIPVVGGVGIAIWSFHSTGKRDHERWVLDLKRAEWSVLLRGVAKVFHITNFTTLNGWNRKIANRIATELEQALEEISIACANCIFLDNFRQNKEGDKKIGEFLKNTKLQAQKLKGNLGLFEYISDRAGIATDIDSKSLYRNIEIISSQISNLAEQSRTLLDWLQDEAALDLGVTAKCERHQAVRGWTKLFNVTRKKTEV
jgi:hypothetical protein